MMNDMPMPPVTAEEELHSPVLTGFHLPSAEQTHTWAKSMVDLFSDGFQWQDIPGMMKIAQGFLSPFPSMTLEEKRSAVVQILNDFMDLTDTPCLPDQYSDPVVKAMIPCFVALVVTDETMRYIPVSGRPAAETIQDAARDVLEAFKDGFQWQDLADVSEFALQFAAKYDDLTADDKAGIAKEIVHFVIDETDTPYLIDSMSDPIFKQIIDPIIDAFFHVAP